MSAVESAPPVANRMIDVRTPYGRPVGWAEVAIVTDIGDSHDLNDDRCLIITSRDLGGRTTGAASEFMLCLLADGATGSTFTPGEGGGGTTQAGWRASQLAQAAFLERFLSSSEIDALDRLKDGLRAADRALVNSAEGSLSTTLTALYLASDGAAYAASIGDSVLLVLPPTRRTPADRRLKKLGYEDTTAVGSGDTTLSYVDEGELIEQWWPNKENDPVDMRVRPGTYFVLLSDGISDNLAIDFIDRLVQRHTLDRAAVGLPRHTREQRAQMQKLGGGSTSELGLDNMSAIVVRFDGGRQTTRSPAARLEDACLFAVAGTHGGPEPSSGGNFGLICLADQQNRATLVPRFLRNWLESEHLAAPQDRLEAAYRASMSGQENARLAALARAESGGVHAFSTGLPDVTALFDVDIGEHSVEPARDSAFQRFIYSPRLWASSLAALALFLLVSTAFATGTVRPAPPPAPTAVAGEPTPTQDTRPRLSLGGVLLVGPPAAATPTPAPPQTPEVLSIRIEPRPTEAPPPDTEPPPSSPECTNPLSMVCGNELPPPPPRRQQPAPAPAPVRRPPACNNLFGIGCQSAPAPPPDPANLVVPVASPGAALPPTGPPSGSNLDDALHVASIAEERFERGLTLPSGPGPTPEPTSP